MRQRTYGGVGSPAREGGLTRLRQTWRTSRRSKSAISHVDGNNNNTRLNGDDDRLALCCFLIIIVK